MPTGNQRCWTDPAESGIRRGRHRAGRENRRPGAITHLKRQTLLGPWAMTRRLARRKLQVDEDHGNGACTREFQPPSLWEALETDPVTGSQPGWISICKIKVSLISNHFEIRLNFVYEWERTGIPTATLPQGFQLGNSVPASAQLLSIESFPAHLPEYFYSYESKGRVIIRELLSENIYGLKIMFILNEELGYAVIYRLL